MGTQADPTKRPRILVVGAGALGGYFGGRLAQAGYNVKFVARSAQLAALQTRGLRLISPLGDLHLQHVTAAEDPRTLGPADVILLCVKLWDLAQAARRAAGALAEGGVMIPLQNGVEGHEIVGRAVGRENVACGVAYIGSEIDAPGVIRHVSSFARLVFGELDGRESGRLIAFLAACEAAGIEARLSRDIQRDLWEKFCFLAPFAGITALVRAPIGGVRADPAAWTRFLAMVDEAISVGRAQGVDLPEDLNERIGTFASGLPEGMKSSMLVDLEHGRRLELDWLTGAIARLGAERGVPTPVAQSVVETLAPLRDGELGRG